MTIKKAVDHFIFKFKNVWKPTNPDIEALKTIIKFVEDKHQKQIQDYQLFAKLYIMVYAQYLDKYKTTVFDEIPQKELHKYLDLPLSHIIESFTKKLNDSELYTLFDLSCKDDFSHIHLTHIESFYKEMGYDDALVKEKVVKISSDRKTSNEKLDELLNNHKDIKDYLYKGKEIWDYETVKDNIELQINNAINKYR